MTKYYPNEHMPQWRTAFLYSSMFNLFVSTIVLALGVARHNGIAASQPHRPQSAQLKKNCKLESLNVQLVSTF